MVSIIVQFLNDFIAIYHLSGFLKDTVCFGLEGKPKELCYRMHFIIYFKHMKLLALPKHPHVCCELVAQKLTKLLSY